MPDRSAATADRDVLLDDHVALRELRDRLLHLADELADEELVPDRYGSTAGGMLAELHDAQIVAAAGVLFRLALWAEFRTSSAESYVDYPNVTRERLRRKNIAAANAATLASRQVDAEPA